MALVARKVTVTTTAVLLTQGLGGAGAQGISDFSAEVQNTDATITLYVGGSGVTTAQGFPVLAGATVKLGELGADDALYGITSSGSIDVRVLELA